jgi:hypothetical protein
MWMPLSHRADPVAFARDKLGFEPDSVQAGILRSANRHVILNCTRQFGKSTIVAALGAHQLCTAAPGSLAVVVSPSARQSAETLRKIAAFLRQAGIAPRPDGVNRHSLVLPNGSRAVALPGRESTIRGFSAPALVVIDEAALVPDQVYQAVRPMLAASNNGRLVLLSTPRGRRGFFYDEWSGSHDWSRFRVPANECPRIPAAFLERERASLGDWAFRQEYMCEFVDNRAALFTPELLSRALSDDYEPWRLR